MVRLGNILRLGGHGIAKVVDASFAWLKKAEATGNEAADLFLAIAYHHGVGVAVNGTLAVPRQLRFSPAATISATMPSLMPAPPRAW
jgi:TPR repeat protein